MTIPVRWPELNVARIGWLHGCGRVRRRAALLRSSIGSRGNSVLGMSIPVAPADIGLQMESFGAEAYLVTVRDDATPHVAHLVMRLDGEVLRCAASRSAAANVAERPNISVLWPPHEPGGYSMIVDAVARKINAEDGEELELRPTSGVLHRPATPATAAAESARGSDCAPLAAEQG